jgi:hypothetical protein
MTLPEIHFRETSKLVKAIPKEKIALWLLKEGYFPEQYVLPPSFSVDQFQLWPLPYHSNIEDLARRKLVPISYPKSLLTSRVFCIQHPWNYHDIVFWMMEDWDTILDHLFYDELKIFTYSFPIPVNARDKGELSPLRSGRMIYEWIEMAENDMVAEAFKYKYLIRADITNFYNSVYTHSIGWALHGREKAYKDKKFKLTGNKIDRLTQYSNDSRTNGIPIGSALSDLIAEIILAKVDLEVSKQLTKKKVDFLGSRFKDDYRIFCHTEQDARAILKELSDELASFNLLINESKTKVFSLPEGLYRQHEREYQLYSLKHHEFIPFKTFELTLLKALDIHKQYPGTSLLEKFISELYNEDHELKIRFSSETSTQKKQILKSFSLLMLLKRESEKTMSQVLGVIEAIYTGSKLKSKLKPHLKELITSEIKKASVCKSAFGLTWLVFFSRYLKLGINNFSTLISTENLKNPFVESIIDSEQKLFNDSGINLFVKPKDCNGMTLAKRFAAFNRTKE